MAKIYTHFTITIHGRTLSFSVRNETPQEVSLLGIHSLSLQSMILVSVIHIAVSFSSSFHSINVSVGTTWKYEKALSRHCY